MLRASLNLLRRITILLIICCYSSAWADAKYGGGTGEPNDPYQIWDANHMQAIGANANDWDKHFILMADIDLSLFDGKDDREQFNVIGTFTGVFDGNGNTISNFTYVSNGIDNIGLFKYLSGEVKNLGLIDPNVNAGTGSSVGSLVGVSRRTTITKCYAEGVNVYGNDQVGGLAGYTYALVVDSYATGIVKGNNCVGGLVGESNDIEKCYATVNVEGISNIGGLVGSKRDFSKIHNSYATGSVEGVSAVGGLVGIDASGGIVNCYAIGRVSGDENVGGLRGSISGCCGIAYIHNSYWDIETSGIMESHYGRTTSQLHQQSTFTDWDFINVWNIGENQTYPYLRTVPAGDINKDKTVNFLDVCIIAEQWCNEE